MKASHMAVFSVILIMIVTAGSGCSSKPEVGSQVISSSVFSTDYKWIEYKMSEDSDIGTFKLEKSTDDYLGSPAIHIKWTFQMSIGSMIADIYYDKSTGKALGGTYTSTDITGQTTTEPLTESQLSDQSFSNEKITGSIFKMDDILTYKGTESVIVPAGSYPDADLYTNVTNGETTSYWMASDIPVPVKIQSNGESIELVSWG